MPGSLGVVIFGSIIVMAMALVYGFSSGSPVVTERLRRLWRASVPERSGFPPPRQSWSNRTLARIAKSFPFLSPAGSDLDPRLLMAGYRRPEAVAALTLARIFVVILLESVVWLTGFYQASPFVLTLVAIGIGFMLPDFWLGRRISARKLRLRLALPDALDLLVICMEAGLGLDQSILYVGQELKLAHPDLCEEFDLLNAEMQVGKSRMDALRSLATRTGVDDIQALTATLVQTDRFGTSIAQSLRVHSDDLRIKRRQRAEELAAKTTVKMVFPLVFFIFPALFVVILGPAVITMLHLLSQLQP